MRILREGLRAGRGPAMTILELVCEYRHGYLFSVEPCDEATTAEDLVKGLNEGTYRIADDKESIINKDGICVAIIASKEPDAGGSQFADWLE